MMGTVGLAAGPPAIGDAFCLGLFGTGLGYAVAHIMGKQAVRNEKAALQKKGVDYYARVLRH